MGLNDKALELEALMTELNCGVGSKLKWEWIILLFLAQLYIIFNFDSMCKCVNKQVNPETTAACLWVPCKHNPQETKLLHRGTPGGLMACYMC